jgi:hypothetical protein
MQGAWTGVFQEYQGEAMQDLGYELPRILILSSSVNKGVLGRSWRLSARARDRDHSNPESPSTTLSPWDPGRR